ncbi:acyl-CoA dehydrogenase family protein [Nonomuraea sp. NPDC050536]|uniref:acyl-CoA dehydrogenase family protein n=1 Tax=Nonomuraea sp. NPDC050536 TaxID=3364366 RepID=UPI0037CC1B6C
MTLTPRPRWLDDDGKLLHETAAKFFATEVVPRWDEFDRNRRVPRDVWLAAGEVGLLCCSIPECYGGGGGTFAHDLAVFSAQAYAGDTGFGISVHSGIVAHYLLAYGTEEQKRRWLPEMAAGRMIGAIAMTEPDGGSDLKNLTTRAVRAGDHYVVTGAKTFVSNGCNADLVIVAARTSGAGAKGISLLVVETGYRRGRVLDKVGMHAQDTAELSFDAVPVPVANLLGDEGAGFAMLMTQLAQERLVIALSAAAAMARALDETVAYVKQRKAFGAPLFEKQHVRFELAECATLVRAGRSFVDDAIEQHLRGRLDTATASMAKWWLTDLQCQVVDRCLQLFGGYGYMREYLVARLWSDARVQKIYGGANEVMKELIARSL